MGLYSGGPGANSLLGGLIIGRIFASEIWGAYFREDLFWGRGGGGLLSEFYDTSTATYVSLTECQKDISQHL